MSINIIELLESILQLKVAAYLTEALGADATAWQTQLIIDVVGVIGLRPPRMKNDSIPGDSGRSAGFEGIREPAIEMALMVWPK